MAGKRWPLARDTRSIGGGWRTPDRPTHRGVDFPAGFGTPIYAAADGWVAHCGINDDPDGFGSWLVIDHQAALGVDTVYGHMPPTSFRVRAGDTVRAGQHIADVGSEGGSTGPHLHFEVWGRPGRFGGRDLDPLAWLADAAEPESTGGKPMGAKPDYVELNRMGDSASSRHGAQIENFLLHTQEGNGTAESLANYLNNPANGVSYHYTVRDRVVVDVVDTDLASWSVLDANRFTINLCFAGSRVSWSREDWLRIRDDIRIAAWLAVQDARKYGFDTFVIAPPYKRRQGISDHRYVTECLGIGTHTDVGPGFPWDIFAADVASFTNSTNLQEDDDMTPEQDRMLREVHRELTQRYPSRSKYRENDKPVDTLAGMTLNIDAREHEASRDVPEAFERLEQAIAELPARIAAELRKADGQ